MILQHPSLYKLKKPNVCYKLDHYKVKLCYLSCTNLFTYGKLYYSTYHALPYLHTPTTIRIYFKQKLYQLHYYMIRAYVI